MELARLRALQLAEADAAAVTEKLARRAPGAAAIEVPRELSELAIHVRGGAVELEASGNPARLADAAGAGDLPEAGEATVGPILRTHACAVPRRLSHGREGPHAGVVVIPPARGPSRRRAQVARGSGGEGVRWRGGQVARGSGGEGFTIRPAEQARD